MVVSILNKGGPLRQGIELIELRGSLSKLARPLKELEGSQKQLGQEGLRGS